MTDCARHPKETNSDDAFAWNYLRCAHVGNRFVVETRNEVIGASHIDYVEDLADGEVAVEPHGSSHVHKNDSQADRDAIYNALVARLIAGDPLVLA